MKRLDMSRLFHGILMSATSSGLSARLTNSLSWRSADSKPKASKPRFCFHSGNWSEREEHNLKSSNRFHINNLLTMLTFVVSHCSGKVFRSPVPGKILEGLWHVDHTCSVETELTMHG